MEEHVGREQAESYDRPAVESVEAEGMPEPAQSNGVNKDTKPASYGERGKRLKKEQQK